MRYGSVCSGIEAATAAWHGLGWKPSFFSEIEAFPRAVLAHHYPDVPLHGDFTTIVGDEYEPIDLLVGGTPCQSFSIAGLRGGLDDDRGNLALEFLRLAQRTRPKWLVWENVPGVLSSNGGRDFGSIIGGMVEIGYGIAYRVLDAQYFGVAQRRRRVFVVGCLGNAASATAVLFERHSLQGHPAPQRTKRPGSAEKFEEGLAGSFEAITDDFEVCGALSDGAHMGGGLNGQDAYTGRVLPVKRAVLASSEEIIPFDTTQITSPKNFSNPKPGDACHPLASTAHPPAIATILDVRRLTPVECERLQGFPDNYTQIPYRNKPVGQCSDGPRYKALGNSMAVPVMRWIGTRINIVEQITGDDNGR